MDFALTANQQQVRDAIFVTPSRAIAAIWSVEKPASRNTSSLCSPSFGASRTGSAVVSEKRAETFMLRICPSVG